MPFELTDQGVSVETVDEVNDEINQELWDNINPGLNLSTATALGQATKIFAAKVAEVEEVARAVYESRDPDGATGASLDRLCAITGTTRDEATKSVAPACVVNVNAGFTAAPGDMVAHVNGDPTRRFVNKLTVTNTGGSPADETVDFVAEEAGPTECFAGTLTVIAEAVVGWNSITNPTDATVGNNEETDSALRVRRRDELTGGTHYVDAIRTDVLENSALGVVYCLVLENDTDYTDANGLPPKSIEVIVYGPASPTSDDDNALAAQIFKSKPAGIQASGTTTAVVVDDQGSSHVIGFSRATPQLVYIGVDITDTATKYPDDGDAEVAEAIAAVGADYQPGDEVIAERLKAAAFGVAGVKDVPALRLGLAPSPPGTTNIPIGLRQIAKLDTSRITVTSTDG